MRQLLFSVTLDRIVGNAQRASRRESCVQPVSAV